MEWDKIQGHDFYTGCGKPDCHWCEFVKTNNMAIALHEIPEEAEQEIQKYFRMCKIYYHLKAIMFAFFENEFKECNNFYWRHQPALYHVNYWEQLCTDRCANGWSAGHFATRVDEFNAT